MDALCACMKARIIGSINGTYVCTYYVLYMHNARTYNYYMHTCILFKTAKINPGGRDLITTHMYVHTMYCICIMHAHTYAYILLYAYTLGVRDLITTHLH